MPTSAEEVILANLIIGTALLAAHELVVDTSVFAVAAGVRHFGSQAARLGLRGTAREGVVVLLGAALFVAVLFWPVIVALGSTVVGDGSDASGKIAELWRMQYEGGYHLFGETHHTLTGAPFGWNEGNGLNLQLLIPYYPAYLVTKVIGPVAGYNLVLLAGYVLSGASMYLLVRYLGCVRAVAAWAGLVYIVFPCAPRPHAARFTRPSRVLAAPRPRSRRGGATTDLVEVHVRRARSTLACWLTSGYFGVDGSRRRGRVRVGGRPRHATPPGGRCSSAARSAGPSGDAARRRALDHLRLRPGAGLNRVRRRPRGVRSTASGAPPSVSREPRARRLGRTVLRRAPARLRPHRDAELPRAHHTRVRVCLARDRVAEATRTRASGFGWRRSGLTGDRLGRAPARGSEPGVDPSATRSGCPPASSGRSCLRSACHLAGSHSS